MTLNGLCLVKTENNCEELRGTTHDVPQCVRYWTRGNTPKCANDKKGMVKNSQHQRKLTLRWKMDKNGPVNVVLNFALKEIIVF